MVWLQLQNYVVIKLNVTVTCMYFKSYLLYKTNILQVVTFIAIFTRVLPLLNVYPRQKLVFYSKIVKYYLTPPPNILFPEYFPTSVQSQLADKINLAFMFFCWTLLDTLNTVESCIYVSALFRINLEKAVNLQINIKITHKKQETHMYFISNLYFVVDILSGGSADKYKTSTKISA